MMFYFQCTNVGILWLKYSTIIRTSEALVNVLDFISKGSVFDPHILLKKLCLFNIIIEKNNNNFVNRTAIND